MTSLRSGLPIAADLVLRQGSSFTRSMTWLDAARKPNNLTGYTARLQIRRRADAPDILLDLSTENGGLVIEAASGLVTIQITSAQTAPLRVGTIGVYDLVLIAPAGEPVTALLEGSVIVEAGVTKP